MNIPSCARKPLDPAVWEAMKPYLTARFGNAASLNHVFGWEAQEACDRAREQIASFLGAHSSREIIFTGGGPESVMLALRGAMEAGADRGRRILLGAPSGAAAWSVCAELEAEGYTVIRLSLDERGRLTPATVRAALTDQAALLTMTLADADGAPQPVAETGRLTRQAGVTLHVDGAGDLYGVPVNVQTQEIDMLSIDGPALAGPPGVGALFVRSRRPRVVLTPIIEGGGQERGWRSGTLNVPGIVGLGAVFSKIMTRRQQTGWSFASPDARKPEDGAAS